jgi:hypothetical protein
MTGTELSREWLSKINKNELDNLHIIGRAGQKTNPPDDQAMLRRTML